MDTPKNCYIEHTKSFVTFKELQEKCPPNIFNEVCISRLPCNVWINREQFNNIESCFGYGPLFDVVRNFIISFREWDGKFVISLGVIIGDKEIIYGFYEKENAAQVFVNLATMWLSDKASVSGIVDPQTGDLYLLKEDVLLNKYNIRANIGGYLNSRARSGIYQTFNIERDLVGISRNSSESFTNHIDIFFNTRAQEMYEQIRNAEDSRNVMNLLVDNSEIYLESSVLIEMEENPTRDLRAPGVDTVKLGLLRRSVWERDDKLVFEITDYGRKMVAGIYSAKVFDAIGLRFIKASEREDMICIIQRDGTLLPFGRTKYDLVPYLSSGDWSCFYWPSLKMIVTADGNESFNTFDGIYLFRSNQ